MKTIRVLGLLGLGFVWSLQVWAVPSFPTGGGELGPTSDQPADTVVNDAAQANGLSVVPPDQVPIFGTFWVFDENGNQPAPLPCPPGDASLPIFTIADGQFLVGDNRDPAGATAAFLTAQADAVATLIAQVQSVPSSHPMFRAMAELSPTAMASRLIPMNYGSLSPMWPMAWPI